MRVITITLFMLVLLSACASDDAPQGVMGPPYNVPDPEDATQEECKRVNCNRYPEYINDPRYCCVGPYGTGGA